MASTTKIDGTATDAQPSGNALVSLNLQVLVSPYLSNANYTGFSATGWYVFSDNVPSFVLAYLNGQVAPTIESEDAAFNSLGMSWRGYLDHGSAQADYRGSVMSDGTV